MPAEIIMVEGRIGRVKPVRTAIVCGSDAWLWIDAGIAGTPRDAILPALATRGLTPPARNIAVITHGDVDHFGGITELREAVPQLVTMAHALDARLMEDLDVLVAERYDRFRDEGVVLDDDRVAQLRSRAGEAVAVDVRLTGAARIDLGDGEHWRVLPAPGHSGGHVVVVSDARRHAFLGDAVMGWGVIDGEGCLLPPHYIDVLAYRSTVDLLRTLDLETMDAAHEARLTGASVDAFLAASAEAVDAIGTAVSAADAVIESDAPDRLARVCADVHARLGRWPDASPLTLADAVSAHLAQLRVGSNTHPYADGGVA
ncbi:MBL fold metallo-hydrolase [Microbacterium sp. EST19A]|uniref:MBL fold metallo-hydrolase n=1 Tax=Microbacterium sp. EST19A TaxID=2862681 RepID=UPI001CBF107D|nr:MBL fold metallo-hydrolase [Microbacterium sp. EST19A]